MTTTINADNVTGGAVVTGDSSGELGLQTAGTTRMTITSAGNVGIGVTPSAAKLHVETSANEVEGSFRNSSASYSSDLIQSYQTNASATLTSFHLLRAYSSGPTVRFHVRGDGEGYFAGNVGIGTSSPDQLATINSANTSTNSLVSFKQGGTTYAYVGMGGDNKLRLQSTSTDVGIQADSANAIFFNSNGSERMRVTSTGNVVIGTAALATSATAGFPWIPSCAGTPTGAPTAPYTNAGALVVDTTNSNLNVRVGSTWRAINTVPSADFKASLTDSTARTYTGGTYYSLGTTSNTITDNSLVAFRLYVQVSDAAWHTAIGGTVAGLCIWKADGTLAEWSFILDGHVTAYSGVTATIRRDAGYGNGPFSIKFSSNITVASGGFVRLDILRLL